MPVLSKNFLAPGERLNRGDQLCSKNGLFYVTIGYFTNELCIVSGTPANPGKVTWRSNAQYVGYTEAVMEPGGAFALYQGSSAVHTGVCATKTTGMNHVVMQDDGQLCVCSGAAPVANEGPLWTSATGGGDFAAGGGPRASGLDVTPMGSAIGKLGGSDFSLPPFLLWGQCLASAGGKYFAMFGPDGDLCVFAGTPANCHGISWRAHAKPGVAQLVLTIYPNGSFGIYNGTSNTAPSLWNSGVTGGGFLIMQDDGNLCLYAGDPTHQGAFIWGSIQNGGKTSNFDPLPAFQRPVPPPIPNSVSGIRVHCMGAFELVFHVNYDGGSTTSSKLFGAGDNMTISVATTGLNAPQGSQIYPVADIKYGTSGHGAGQNCVFDRTSPMVGVYNITGGCRTPSFSFQENSSDVGSNASWMDSMSGGGDDPTDGLNDLGSTADAIGGEG